MVFVRFPSSVTQNSRKQLYGYTISRSKNLVRYLVTPQIQIIVVQFCNQIRVLFINRATKAEPARHEPADDVTATSVGRSLDI
jgi:hypothetical protein